MSNIYFGAIMVLGLTKLPSAIQVEAAHSSGVGLIKRQPIQNTILKHTSVVESQQMNYSRLRIQSIYCIFIIISITKNISQ